MEHRFGCAPGLIPRPNGRGSRGVPVAGTFGRAIGRNRMVPGDHGIDAEVSAAPVKLSASPVRRALENLAPAECAAYG